MHKIIIKNSLEKANFYLVNHPAQKNWRQINNNIEKRLNNIETGMIFDMYNPVCIKGEELIKITDVDKFKTAEKPIVSISSRLFDLNQEKHMLMMNIHLDAPISIDKLVESFKSICSGRFWIIKTDRFYHIYTENIVCLKEWYSWNLKFLMLDSLVSPRYIGHSLERGFNLLRLNSTDRIKTIEPHVVYDSQEDGNG